MNKMRSLTETEIIKKNQTEILELNSTVNEMKNAIKRINSRMDQRRKNL